MRAKRLRKVRWRHEGVISIVISMGRTPLSTKASDRKGGVGRRKRKQGKGGVGGRGRREVTKGGSRNDEEEEEEG